MRVWSIPGALVKGYREAVGLAIAGIMAFVFGCIYTTGGGSALAQEYQFFTSSTTGVAEVIGKTQTGQKNFFVDCRLLLTGSGKTTYERRIPVYAGLWQSLRKGQTLNVDYLRNDPATMRLQGSIGDLGDAFLHLLTGSVLVVVGGFASTAAIQFFVRERRSRKMTDHR